MIKRLLLFTITYSILLSTLAAQHSVAREWNEVLLTAIRNDFARPTVHARNLFHTSVAMYDAWAAYDDEANTFFLGKTLGGYDCAFDGISMPADIAAARDEAISYAAYRILKHRFANSPGVNEINTAVDGLMAELAYDPSIVSQDYSTGQAAALGNYIASQIIAFGLQDGANEVNDYANQYYEPVNPPLIVELPGNPDIEDPNRWQPLTLTVFIDQSGNIIPGATPGFLSPEWGQVIPFALSEDDLSVFQRDGFDYNVYHDPGPPPYLDTENDSGLSPEYKWGHSLVSVWSAHLSPADGVMWDISPASIGNLSVDDYPTNYEDFPDFYDLINGGDPGEGHALNPATGLPYEPQIVPRGDYARILAEFWADGPDSETPPGHWFTLLNYVNDHSMLVKQFGGQGEVLDELEWDVKAYLMLGGAMHDVAVSIWGIKGWYDYARPITAIRTMADLGQSTDPSLPSYHVGGIPLVDGRIELVQAGDPLAGNMNQHVGKIKLYAWRGPDYVTIPEIQEAGVGWILAENWWPYQRPSFVTPNFAGYLSGHSTYSRAAAEILTALTGDPFFPGGMGEFFAPHDEFLVFEDGPSMDITLQWATYRDASDQCSLSRIWGGIHPPADDIFGRLIGIEIGNDAFALAKSIFYRDEDEDGFYSYEDCDDNDPNEFPGQVWYTDNDEDGYGDGQTITACERPANGHIATELTAVDTDCDDNDANEFPGQVWYTDNDEDGYGDGQTITACERPANGHIATELTAIDTDCDDNDANEFPGQVWYTDNDEDGYGDGQTITACERPTNGHIATELTAVDTDCDDNDANEFPGQVWYTDNDEDGYGDGQTITACERPANAYIMAELTAVDTDCNDSDANEHPDQMWWVDNDEDGFVHADMINTCARPTNGYLSSEINTDEKDCNDENADEFPGQIWYLDQDEDGYGAGQTVVSCNRPEKGFLAAELNAVDTDCDDNSDTVYPNATEIADNGIDEDCNNVDLFLISKFYPNPVRSQLTIHYNYDQVLKIKVYNSVGQLILKKDVTLEHNQLLVDTKDWEAGMYIVQLEDEQGNVVLEESIMRI